MKYEDALKAWGMKRLQDRYPNVEIEAKSVSVDLDFSEGYQCCGGRDPDCYCSLADSPSCHVSIIGWHGIRQYQVQISQYEFNFATILGEIVDAADGTVTR